MSTRTNHATDSLIPDADLLELTEEISRRLRANESIHIEDFAQGDSQRLEQLRRILPTLQALAELGHSPDNHEAVLHGGAPVVAQYTIGDYRIIRQIGRGGMGVVYEAEQLSLGRRVALKVLPFAAVLDKRQIQRFKNESLAAAQLDHPNVVDVYGVGCERAVHYYAMRYVDGKTLATIIRQLQHSASQGDSSGDRASVPVTSAPAAIGGHECCSQPTNRSTPSAIDTGPLAEISTYNSTRSSGFFRNVTQIGIQVALALDHAHQHGVVHRDVKPSNILVDVTGKAWITDFGLARLDTEGNLTVTGDLLGTIRYMSPEQALAKRVVIDHRTDIYSLAVTLYELLTLQAAFPDEERQELVRKVAFDEPIAPRKLNRSIPLELETIVVKAMSKNPAERFETARDFAEDLQRFLDDKPILAKRPSPLTRVAKWTRRHRGLINSAAVVLLLAFAGLAATTLAIAREKQRIEKEREIVLDQRDEANRQLYLAHIRLASSDWQEGHIARMENMLDAHIPQPGEPDLRGWEWWYLNSLKLQESSILYQTDVACVAYNPDGAMIASGGGDYSVVLWDTKTRSQLFTLKGHRGRVNFVAWSPDGKRLASASSDRTAIVWDVATGVRLATLEHAANVDSVSWSSDGTQLGTAGFDNGGPDEGTARVWDAETGRLVHNLKQEGWVRQLDWRPNRRQFVTVNREHVTLWDADSGRPVSQLNKTRPDNKFYVRWSPDGSRLIEGGHQSGTGSIALWDIDNKDRIYENLTAHKGRLTECCWKPDGTCFATVGAAGLVQLWKAETGELLSTLRGHLGGVTGVAWSPDGNQLATAGTDGTIRLWDPNTEQGCRTVKGTARFAWSPDGRYLAAPWVERIAGETSEQWILRTSSRQQPKTISILDATTGQTIRKLSKQYDLWLCSFAWSPDGKTIAFTTAPDAYDRGQLVVWDLDANGELWNGPCRRPYCVAWSPDGNRLVTGHYGAWNVRDNYLTGEANIWEASTGKVLRKFENLSDVILSAVWSPSGDRIALKTRNERVYICDPETGRTILQLTANQFSTSGDGQYCLAWSPDGKRIATGDGDGGLIVWDSKSGREVLTTQAHSQTIYCLSWSPDGRRLATGGSDEIVKIWDAGTGDELMAFREGGVVGAIAWDPTGRRLGCASGREPQIRIREAPGYDPPGVRAVENR